jgi:hypothetical protein
MDNKYANPAFYIGIIAGIKVVLSLFGYNIITDEQVNSIANGVAALVAVGVLIWAKFHTATLTADNQTLRAQYAKLIAGK